MLCSLMLARGVVGSAHQLQFTGQGQVRGHVTEMVDALPQLGILGLGDRLMSERIYFVTNFH